MEVLELIERISNGEDSYTQFKSEIKNKDSLALELIAFSNAEGGILIIGVDDKTNEIVGISDNDIRHLNQLLGNVIRDNIEPLIYPLIEIKKVHDKKVVIIKVSKGNNKPYCNKNGLYYTKAGSDKRQISPEELRRLFAESKVFYADEQEVIGSNITDLNMQLYKSYLEKANKKVFNDLNKNLLDLNFLLENEKIMKNNQLTLAGNLIFGFKPEKFNKLFYVSCCYFDGNDSSVTKYISKRRIYGDFETLYNQATGFIKSHIQNRQENSNFNSNGVPEISYDIIGELVTNALIHRDYFINSSIKIFIFHNRVEIINPGKLINSLTVENIKNGRSISRNPILDSICEYILPYSGYGSGIKRVLEINPNVEFINDIDKEEFKCIIPRSIANKV